ncbi:MAG TPA: hypothetical protein VKK06_10030 [Terriglobia bacterium]|nr:hypothetical protein [Terriglobia bacterium]
MDSAVRLLFDEVADLTRGEREKLFAGRQIAPELRTEIASLLSFDSTSDHGLTERVADATEELMSSDHNAASVHWGPLWRPIRTQALTRNSTGTSRIYEALATLHLRNGNAAQAQSISTLRP